MQKYCSGKHAHKVIHSKNPPKLSETHKPPNWFITDLLVYIRLRVHMLGCRNRFHKRKGLLNAAWEHACKARRALSMQHHLYSQSTRALARRDGPCVRQMGELIRESYISSFHQIKLVADDELLAVRWSVLDGVRFSKHSFKNSAEAFLTASICFIMLLPIMRQTPMSYTFQSRHDFLFEIIFTWLWLALYLMDFI